MTKKLYHRVLTIAGSDSGSGAGIQADLKTFSALGCFGMSAITALTAQNTREVRAIESISPSFVEHQLEAVLEDIGVDAIKIGMLFSSEIIHVVAKILKKYNLKNIVLDPVMIAKSGDSLLKQEATDALVKNLIPLSHLITPNLPEASVLLGRPIKTKEEMEEAATDLLRLGSNAVLIKGGHLTLNDSSDFLLTKRKKIWLDQERIETPNAHGTGCTLSSAIAAHLAKNYEIEEAVILSKQYLSAALKKGSEFQIGKGHGPVHHFHHWW